MQKHVGNLGIRLKVVSWVGNEKFEKEKVLFSVRQLYKLLKAVKANDIIYGLSIGEDGLTLHLFIDRGGAKPSAVEKTNRGVMLYENCHG